VQARLVRAQDIDLERVGLQAWRFINEHVVCFNKSWNQRLCIFTERVLGMSESHVGYDGNFSFSLLLCLTRINVKTV
jgi:hypothetical protein